MYNQYIPKDAQYAQVEGEELPVTEISQEPPPALEEGKESSSWLTGLLKTLHLDEIDSGDVLLLLILLFLFLEGDGDHVEMAIILGILVLVSLGGKGKGEEGEKGN